ncbi:MAG TPA: NAD(P)-binding domain-containing protein [Acidimicrobiales bacterium]|nr:NAD(P)-binding domain-containing protein [Acidimicrobiales bacterium]
MRAAVVGAGAVGVRAARQLLFLGTVDSLAVVDPDPARVEAVVASLGHPARAEADLGAAVQGTDVVVLARPRGHAPAAEAALDQNASVVSVSDDVDDVRALLALDAEAVERGVSVVVGAGFSPGLSCLLAAHAARSFEVVEEIHVAKVGTGGPACARQHHVALQGPAVDGGDGVWHRRRGGSGRALVWFPDPVCGVDCYRAALPEPLLLAPAFPAAQRLTARVGANRRDRLTAHLPMLRRPHPEGTLGAVRVEVRGRQGQVEGDRVLGAIDRPAVAAGAVAALAAHWAAAGRLTRPGAGGLGELADPGPFLAALADRGVKAAIFEGAGASANQA